MSVTGPLAAFTLKSLFPASADQLLGWVGARFANPRQPLQLALARANDRTWKTIGLALAGEGLFERIQDRFPGYDFTPLAQQFTAFRAMTPTGLEQISAATRFRACLELLYLRGAGRLTLSVDRFAVVADLWRCGDPAKIMAGFEQAVGFAAHALADAVPHLASVLPNAIKSSIPLLAAAFQFYFRRELELDPDLGRGATFDALHLLTANTERGLAVLADYPSGLLDQFDPLFNAFGEWLSRVLGELNGVREELQNWLQSNGVTPRGPQSPIRVNVSDERERHRARAFADQFRRLPTELLEVSDWQHLGTALDACGLFEDAFTAHATATNKAHVEGNHAAEAESAFRVYLDACELRKWTEAKGALLHAVKLDAARFQVFDAGRYQLDTILGGSRFGMVFRCLDTEELDSHGNPVPVVIRSLRCDSLNRDARAAFAEARALRDLHRPGNRIGRVLSWGYAQHDPENHTRKERPYLVTEYFPAETLEAFVQRNGLLPCDIFLPLALQIAETLQGAHGVGVYHRDVRPANVLCRFAEGVFDLRLINFGIVVHANHQSSEADASADIVAFGRMCFWLLFGTMQATPAHWAAVPDSKRIPLQEILDTAAGCNPAVLYRSFAPIVETLAFLAMPELAEPVAMAETIDIPVSETYAEQSEPLPTVAPQRMPTRPTKPTKPTKPKSITPRPEPKPEPQPEPEPPVLEPAEPEPPPVVEAPQSEPEEQVPVLDPVEEKAAQAGPESGPIPVLEPVEETPPVPAPEAEAPKPPEEPKQAEPPPKQPETPEAPEKQEKQEKQEKPKTLDPLHPGRKRSAGDRMVIKLPGDVPLAFAWCPAGTFDMGSDREDANSDERPMHSVTLTRGYFIGVYPVTQAQWKAALMGDNPSNFPGPDRPVEQVLWEEAQRFCRRISRQLKGRAEVRLPTEAQWEYACRAGTSTHFHTGDSEEALQQAGWYQANSGKQTHPVGKLAPNAWGIHDMHGNVWEWCSDWYSEYSAESVSDPEGAASGSDRVFRGGGWGDPARYCRSAYRSWFDPQVRYDALGFRVVMVLTG